MTSEIALMNRHAIALAADSAVTVTYFRDGEPKERYFKGANKIFNLSPHEPVALMINDTADLHGIPWEVIAKAYREHLGGTKLERLEEYAAHFFKFIEGNDDLYPPELQKRQFLSDVQTAASIAIFICENPSRDEKDEIVRNTRISEAFQGLKSRIENGDLLCDLTQNDVTSALEKYRDEVVAIFNDWPEAKRLSDPIPTPELADASLIAMFKLIYSPLNYRTSGIVIAGFGTKEFFPRLEIHKCHGSILGHTLYNRTELKAISHDNTSEVVPLAQSDMAVTFMNGISADALKDIDSAVDTALSQFETDLKAAGTVAADMDLSAKRAELKGKLGDSLSTKFTSSHTMPMKRVVGMLPVDELAELAEILIRVESLKERVTRESEQVGGPIDVAVISKGDGFIWIKRKHYFKPDLNPRYFARKGVRDHDYEAEKPPRKIPGGKSKARTV